MAGFSGVNLQDMINEIGEVDTKEILSDFYCPYNYDIENFLKTKAIEFSKQGIAVTYLVFASYRKENVLVGYYTLANKMFCIEKDSLPSKNWRKRINKFAQFDRAVNRYTISAPLIGQIGKNYASGYDKLISGDELLSLALDKVRQMQMIVGGKIVYLECEDKVKLIDFYEQNGFVSFGKRMLDRDETSDFDKEYLIQMLKYMK